MLTALTKQIFLESCQCLTRGWYLRSNTISIPLSNAEQFRIREGMQIGAIARALYPEGILIPPGDNSKNAELTAKLMDDENVNVIFEATFTHNELVAKADILLRDDDGWQVIEVKSAAASNDINPIYIDDLAYTSYVIDRNNIYLTNTSLLMVAKTYRLGMDDAQFFAIVDCTEEVAALQEFFSIVEDDISTETGNSQRPDPELITGCKECYFYKTSCLGKDVSHPIFDLPNLKSAKFDQLKAMDALTISSIPIDFELSPLQKTVYSAVQDNKPIIDINILRSELDKIEYPVYYLDFETVSTAIPLYEKIAPYEEIVTQYSIHEYSAPYTLTKHMEFLADHGKDDRRTLALKLIADMGMKGSVIVYHAGAEKKYLKNLGNLFSDLQPQLQAISDRIIDLKEILKHGYYHPEFHGSYSIKTVLPVLVPEMKYSELAVSNGEEANTVFAELARNLFKKDEEKLVRQNLLVYCRQDTLAMVKIHEFLLNLITIS